MPLLDSLTLEHLLTCLKRPPTWLLLRAEQNGQTHVLRYAYATGVPPVWEEDLLLCLSHQKLYVLQHTATEEQGQALLAWLQDCLHTSGLATAEFQEP